MADLIITREQLATGDGISIMIEGGRPSEYSINTVQGYGAKYNDAPVEGYDYAWCNATASVIDGNRERAAYYAAKRAQMPRLKWGAIIEIEGLGSYALMAPSQRWLDGDHPVLVPVDGGVAGPQARKRLARSEALGKRSDEARAADRAARGLSNRPMSESERSA